MKVTMAQVRLMRCLILRNYTVSEVAEELGIQASTVRLYTKAERTRLKKLKEERKTNKAMSIMKTKLQMKGKDLSDVIGVQVNTVESPSNSDAHIPVQLDFFKEIATLNGII